ncbi:MAG: peptidase M15 [Bacteroidales bacterium]|nr:peptidase M15 [Bacteroidales bacterium]
MKHFSTQELVCKHCGQLPPSVKENIEALVDNVLDPLREQYGKPVYVTSGYRCLRHNTAVGGVPNSQHTKGEACDIHAGNPAENLKLAKIIAAQGRFDQLILYVNSATSLEPRFVHVSYKRSGTNRKRILKQVAGTTGYSVVPKL